MTNPYNARTELLVGPEAMQRIAQTPVAVFGVGGVGSWCAESLVRSGISHLTIVDPDCVAPSNLNRQLMATTLTLGKPKVEALRERLLAINPQARITALRQTYTADTAADFALENYRYVVDAIDSLGCKMELILHATSLAGVTLYSSMGAALKMDPTQVRVSEFWQVDGCPLAAALRRRMRRNRRFPAHKFLCTWSPEVLPNRGTPPPPDDSSPLHKAVTNGSLVHITAIMGFTLAGLVVQDIVKWAKL